MPSREENVILTVDVTLFTLRQGSLAVALQRRDRAPFSGRPALIGGYVHANEDRDTMATALRVLRDKAGLRKVFLEQLMTFSGPNRDPRGWSASVAYYALVPEQELAALTSRDVFVVPVEEARGLPFDHDAIIGKGVERLRGKGSYSSLPAFLLPETFTLTQLREMYEKVMGVSLNDSAFRRKIEELHFVEPVEGAYSKATARPARLYRLRRAALTEFDRRL